MAVLTAQEIIDQRLRYRLNYLNTIECWNHPGRFTSTTSVSFPYQNWNSSPLPLLRKNGVIVTPDSVDYTTGAAVVSSAIQGDDITADYSFEYFTDEQLTSFIYNALDRYNMMPPKTTYAITTYPEEIADWITIVAYSQCLKTILIDLTMWKARLIFADPQMLASMLQANIASLENDLGKMIKPRYTTGVAVSSGRWRTPATVSDHSWQQYTVMQGYA